MDVFYTAPALSVTPVIEEAVSRSEASSMKGSVSAQPSVHGSAHGSVHGSAHGSARGSVHSSAPHSDVDEDNALEDLERNIATLQRSLENKDTVIDIESGDESRARKMKMVGKRFLK